jgi:hypothetical protein
MMVICSVRIKWTMAPSTITGRKKTRARELVQRAVYGG